MLPYTIILVVIIIIVFFISSLIPAKRRLIKLIDKKSNYHAFLKKKSNDDRISNTIYKLIKDFKYNIELADFENNQYILSDKITFFTWGFYYLIELDNEIINIYLKPRFFLELNKFGLFQKRLEKIKSLISLIEKNH
jgi:hypothetical protein